MKIDALLHILFMANLVGLLIPEILLARRFRLSSEIAAKLAIARAHLSIITYSFILVPLIVITGAGRVAEVGYSWFAFGTTFWLATKQTAGLFMLIWVAVSWRSVRRLAKSFISDGVSDDQSVNGFDSYKSIRARSHVITGLAWVLLGLAVLKP